MREYNLYDDHAGLQIHVPCEHYADWLESLQTLLALGFVRLVAQ